MYQKLVVNFRANTSNREKIKTIEEMWCLYKQESKKRVKVLVQELRKQSWIVPRTFFWKVSFLLDFIWAWKKKTILSKQTHFQSQQLKHLNKVWVTFKVYNKGICFDVVLVSFLLISNIFYNLFWCSYCWLWTYIFLLRWQFVSYPLVHVTFFSLMKHEVVRAYILISQFSTKISAVDFRLLFKKLLQFFFWLLFQNPLWLLAYFYVVVEVDNLGYINVLGCSETIPMAAEETATGRIYMSLVVWMHVQRVGARYEKG